MKASLAILLVALIASASAAKFTEEQYNFLFARFTSMYGKNYKSSEMLHRYGLFKNNLDYIATENEKGHAYTLAVNEYADMSHEEFVLEKVSGLRAPVSHNNADKLANGDVPDAVDWREKNAVTPVKNQQQCGSCWAFSTTGAVEGAYAAATGTLYSLSEQELVDCSKSYGNDGCNGGLMDQGFQYVVDNKGLCLETAYKYTAKDGTCASAKCSHVAPITGYKDVSEKDLDELKAAIALRPVAVAIEADESAFQFYSSGVFDASCGTNLDHGVLAVGYGNMDGKDMWIVKNSWGATWGSKGYINLVRESGKGAGQCGIAMAASYAIA